MTCLLMKKISVLVREGKSSLMCGRSCQTVQQSRSIEILNVMSKNVLRRATAEICGLKNMIRREAMTINLNLKSRYAMF